ncbi:MAG: hypothetical protein DWI72_02705 [Candidatus Aquidulcis sp.]|nr:MAG: hypothetical protein DWI72_02705 [Candidatus Aquidulcis sp.]
MIRLTRRALSTLTALVMVGTLFIGAPAPAVAADPPIIYYIAQSGTAAENAGDGTSCAAPDYVEDPAGDDHASISSALAPASNGDTIYLCAGTYDIGITINLAGETITLQGADAATTILDGGGDTQILTSSGAITVSNLTFQDGYTAGYGGAINADTTATVSSSTFTNNDAVRGGAIYADTTADVSDSTFTNNTAVEAGGAIYAYDTATVTDSTFTNNSAVYYGGAILATTATVTDSTFTNNSAVYYGGAIRATTATVSTSTFTDNTANYGGAIRATTTATVSSSTFTNNDAVRGGAILASNTATVSSSTFTNNDAVRGGAILASNTATVTDSTFTRNSATADGGAILANTGTIAGSRFTRNTAGGHGGAVHLWAPNSDNLQQLRRNTFTRNRAGVGGAITLGSCGPAVSSGQVRSVERGNRFSANRATEQRRTNNIESETGYCGD